MILQHLIDIINYAIRSNIAWIVLACLLFLLIEIYFVRFIPSIACLCPLPLPMLLCILSRIFTVIIYASLRWNKSKLRNHHLIFWILAFATFFVVSFLLVLWESFFDIRLCFFLDNGFLFEKFLSLPVIAPSWIFVVYKVNLTVHSM